MSFNWSNPSSSNFTAAQAQSQFQVPNANIGTIVAALLKQKNDQENREQQQQQDLIKGIGQAAVGYEKGQQAGQADDAANAAMYGAQNPGDAMGGYTNPDVVPDYGGTDALKDYLLQQKSAPNPLYNQLTQAKINSTNALASGRWNGGSTGGTSGYDSSQPETVVDDQGREWRRGNGGQWFPMFSASKNYSGLLSGKNAPTMPTQMIYPDDGTPDTPQPEQDAVTPPAAAAPPSAPLPPSVSPNDVGQVAQAPGSGGDLRQQAAEAISRGADEAAVRARYKQLTGQDL